MSLERYVPGEAQSLGRFGLTPDESDLPLIRRLLERETEAESRGRQGWGDFDLLKLCCVQLFSRGDPGDVLLIWRAKNASMDAGFSVEIQLLCGAGLEATKDYLRGLTDEEAGEALRYLLECEAAGDFKDFSPEEWMGFYRGHYSRPGGE